FLYVRRPPRPPLFPYTTLFRSDRTPGRPAVRAGSGVASEPGECGGRPQRCRVAMGRDPWTEGPQFFGSRGSGAGSGPAGIFGAHDQEFEPPRGGPNRGRSRTAPVHEDQPARSAVRISSFACFLP